MRSLETNDLNEFERRTQRSTSALLDLLREHHDYSVWAPPPRPIIELVIEAPAIVPEKPVLAEPEKPSVLDCPQCAEFKAALDRYRPEARDRRPYPPIKEIQAVVAKLYNVSRGDICSARRTAKVVWPRQIAMYLTKEMTPFSLPQIGRQFGNRDHTTVLHAVRKITALVRADWLVAYDVAHVEAML